MNQADQQLKKRWLTLLGLSVLNSISAFLLEFKYNPINQNVPVNLMYGMMLLSLFSALGFAYITYRCAYKKPGTKLITIFVAIGVAVLVVNPIVYFTGKLPMPTYIPYYPVYLIATHVFGIVWMATCWQLRKLNKRLQMALKVS